MKPSSSPDLSAPLISIVVVVYNMRREAPRALLSLSAGHQHIQPAMYEVLVVDNGSSEPLARDKVEAFGGNFRYFRREDTTGSPAGAVNFGRSQARGRFIGVMIDGARILTPGVLEYTCRAVKAYDCPVVSTLGYHLGHKVQHEAIADGYTQQKEDELLKSINWPRNGYGLFEIAALAGSCRYGWFAPVAESNAVFLAAEAFDRLNGFDERFNRPGGGLVNLDFYKRACELPETNPIVLLGEGAFHQLHGGTSTNMTGVKERAAWWEQNHRHYRDIRGDSFHPPLKRPDYLGHIPDSCLETLRFSVQQAVEAQEPGSDRTFLPRTR